MESLLIKDIIIKPTIIISIIFISLFFIFPLPVILVADNNEEYTRLEYQYNEYIIMPETLVSKIKMEDNDYILYDVRNPEDYSKYHIIGAINLPWDKLWNELKNGNSHELLPFNKQIILISSDGFYSLKAIELLMNRGYTSVFSIEGGMDNWPYNKLLIK